MSTSSKKITLKSSDEETFEVDEVVARESKLIKNMIEYDGDYMDSVIPLPNVTSKILVKVIEYCEKHVEASNPDENNMNAVNEELKAWVASSVMVDQPTLFDLIRAANFLNIEGLLDLTCQAAVDMIKSKTPEIYKAFNIISRFTPEEEEEFLRENQWAFEYYKGPQSTNVSTFLKIK